MVAIMRRSDARTRLPLLSTEITSPSWRLPSASRCATDHNDDQEPMSLQPQLTGTTAARSVFSITA